MGGRGSRNGHLRMRGESGGDKRTEKREVETRGDKEVKTEKGEDGGKVSNGRKGKRRSRGCIDSERGASHSKINPGDVVGCGGPHARVSTSMGYVLIVEGQEAALRGFANSGHVLFSLDIAVEILARLPSRRGLLSRFHSPHSLALQFFLRVFLLDAAYPPGCSCQFFQYLTTFAFSLVTIIICLCVSGEIMQHLLQTIRKFDKPLLLSCIYRSCPFTRASASFPLPSCLLHSPLPLFPGASKADKQITRSPPNQGLATSALNYGKWTWLPAGFSVPFPSPSPSASPSALSLLVPLPGAWLHFARVRPGEPRRREGRPPSRSEIRAGRQMEI